MEEEQAAFREAGKVGGQGAGNIFLIWNIIKEKIGKRGVNIPEICGPKRSL